MSKHTFITIRTYVCIIKDLITKVNWENKILLIFKFYIYF